MGYLVTQLLSAPDKQSLDGAEKLLTEVRK